MIVSKTDLCSCEGRSVVGIASHFQHSGLRRSTAAVVMLLVCFGLASPATAKDRLGVYQSWAAFRDARTPRCYAIAAPEETKYDLPDYRQMQRTSDESTLGPTR